MAALAGYFVDLADARRAAEDLLEHGLPAPSVTIVTEGDELAVKDDAVAVVIADCEEATAESIANALRRNGAFDIQPHDGTAGAVAPT
jgi:hypothetical protein